MTHGRASATSASRTMYALRDRLMWFIVGCEAGSIASTIQYVIRPLHVQTSVVSWSAWRQAAAESEEPEGRATCLNSQLVTCD